MLYDVIDVKVIGTYKIHLRFEDGTEGNVDVSEVIPFKGVFEKLKNPDYFATVKVSKELGTVIWDNGADLSPSFLYSVVSSQRAA